jgi:hypothetical protein
MADLTISLTSSLDANSARHAVRISELFAGEALPVCAPCYIGADGLVYKSVSTVVIASGVSAYAGFTPDVVASGCPVTLFGAGSRMDCSTSLTPGAIFFVSDTAGKISDTKIAVNDDPIAMAVSETDIVVLR